MPIEFPSSPITGESYTYGSKTWNWNGSSWNLTNSAGAGITGPTGATATDDTGGACVSFGLDSVWVRPPHSIVGGMLFYGSTTYFQPIWINSPVTFDAIAMRTTTLTTTGDVSMAIYNDHTTNPGRPGTVLLRAGSVPYLASNTTYSININQTLQRGWYWTACIITSGNSTWRGFNAYVESYWGPKVRSGGPTDNMVSGMISTAGATFSDNPSVDYPGYQHPVVYLRTATKAIFENP